MPEIVRSSLCYTLFISVFMIYTVECRQFRFCFILTSWKLTCGRTQRERERVAIIIRMYCLCQMNFMFMRNVLLICFVDHNQFVLEIAKNNNTHKMYRTQIRIDILYWSVVSLFRLLFISLSLFVSLFLARYFVSSVAFTVSTPLFRLDAHDWHSLGFRPM